MLQSGLRGRFKHRAAAIGGAVILLMADLSPRQTISADFRTSPGTQAATLEYDLPTLWRHADAVVHLRIQKSAGIRGQAPGEPALLVHRATAIEYFRNVKGLTPAGIDVLQANTGNRFIDPAYIDPPFKPGEEFIAFLRWHDTEEAFLVYIMAPVKGGRVRSPHIAELITGMKLEPFLVILRTMME